MLFDWDTLFSCLYLNQTLTNPTILGFAPSEDSTLPGHSPSLRTVFALRSLGN